MLDSKYSKVLTVILIIAVLAILGLLVFVGIDWYKAYTTGADSQDFLEQFNDAVIGGVSDISSSSNGNTQENKQNIAIIDGNTIGENTASGNENGGNGSGGNNGGSSGGSTSNKKLTYKGFTVIGTIKIPKTKIEYPILETVTPKSIEASIAKLYGPGINQVGNTVLIGHNYRNGTFFSNNNKLSEGDKIYLTDLQGQTVTYKITRKYTTDTNDFDYATRDTAGKREISLSTCTTDTKSRLIIWAEEE